MTNPTPPSPLSESFRQQWPADEAWCGPHWRPVRVCQQIPNDLQTCQPPLPGRPWETAGRAEGGPASDEHGASLADVATAQSASSEQS